MYIMTIDVSRLDSSKSTVTKLKLINTNNSVGIITKKIKDKKTFVELAKEVAEVILTMKPSKLIIDTNGIGSALDELLPKELLSKGIVWYKDADLIYDDKERK